MFSRVYSGQTLGLDGHIVTVETDISNGLHNFSIIGLGDKAVEEARDRVGAALKNIDFESPKQANKKIVVSLFPADLKKEGSFFDVAISMGYLLSSKQIHFDAEGVMFLGELSLNGELRSIRGTLPLVQKAKAEGFHTVVLPKENAVEGALVEGITIFGAQHIQEVVDHFNEETNFMFSVQPQTPIVAPDTLITTCFSDVKGQESAKRGLLIAAAGGHNISMYGPPGTGKTMLARAFTELLPDLSTDEVLEVTGIHSVSGILSDGELVIRPPFRAPHNTSSYVSIIGGGTTPKPGEVTLAHKGVLFLDEFPEFDRRVLESLRQPLEDKFVSISRAKGSAKFPTNFIMIAAMNPPDEKATAADISRFERKISGPIMDRIDLWVQVDKIDYETLGDKTKKGETSAELKKKIFAARQRQHRRLGGKLNSNMNVKDIEKHIALSDEVKTLLNTTARQLKLSPRVYHRVLKLAQTIADLDQSDSIEKQHVLEALQYRPKQLY